MQYTFIEQNGYAVTMHLWLIAFIIRKPFRLFSMLSPTMKANLLLLLLFLLLSTLLSSSLFRFDLYLGFLRSVVFYFFMYSFITNIAIMIVAANVIVVTFVIIGWVALVAC